MRALTANDQAELVGQAKLGSQAAFARIVQLYHKDVRWFLCRKIDDMSAVDDIAQEVFLAAMNQIHTLRNSESVRSWLITIARNKAVDHLRSVSRQTAAAAGDLDRVLLDARLERVADSVAFGHDHRELVSVLNDCIEGLQSQSKSLLRKFYFDNQPAEHIASSIGKQPGAVRMILLRVRKSLAKCIHKKLGRGFQL